MLLEASDIHLEPRAESLQVRYRIDGKLMRRSEDVPLRFHPAIVNRLKAMAEMKISERRKPQDGQLSVQFPADRRRASGRDRDRGRGGGVRRG